ncbi:MAG: hypothetical protein H9Q65_03405 [Spiroplasma ixodetis]|nr:hypothetical protein [Spiroplasma ixodetis]MBP1528283.1 hypothetical protein [Spiroplasma ixodetis]
MENKNLKILRYNTGNDKKVFLEFKDYFDVALINANIVSYSKSAIGDLISIHKKEYIIDPQTHIFMHDPKFFSDTNGKIKVSIKKYIEIMPKEIKEIILQDKRALIPEDINFNIIKKLNHSIYDFQANSINKNLEEKEYNKYLKFMDIKINPKFIIAPYFMLKNEDSHNRKIEWLNINKQCIENFIKEFQKNTIANIAIQLVIDKKTLLNENILNLIKKYYDIEGYVYIFLWIDNFYSFTASKNEKNAFKKLILLFNSIHKKVILSYGGYDSILLCHEESPVRLFGVAQSAGYGEYREITPIGGGIPSNKFYFLPIHYRMDIDNASKLLADKGYFLDKNDTNLYYEEICDCIVCKSIIKNDIHNFKFYTEANPFAIKTKYGSFQRNKPTTNAKLISYRHFMYCKKKEWETIKNSNYKKLINELKQNFTKFDFLKKINIEDWIDIFGK